MNDEINLIEVARTLWNSRRKILIIMLAFGVFGLFVVLVTPVEYTAKTIMVSRSDSKTSGTGNLNGLAAMMGIDLGLSMSAGSELKPIDYPEFIKSLPFQKRLMYTSLTWEHLSKPVTLHEYYAKYYKPEFFVVVRRYTIGLPGEIAGWFTGNGKDTGVGKAGIPDDSLVYLTNPEQRVRGVLTKKVKLTLNPKNNFITITVRAPEAKAAAQLANKARELLQEKDTELKILKAKQTLQFTQGLYEEKKKEFSLAQERLSQFRDRNVNLGSEMAKNEEAQLNSEYQIAFSVYNEMAKQLENAKIRVKEDTPIFSIIEEAAVPNVKSQPQLEKILLIWLFLGGVVGFVWVLAARFLREARKQWAEKL
jgi:uncharacterized protein involved in exopolysaccharide biosynthesis